MTQLRAILVLAVWLLGTPVHAETFEWLRFPTGLNHEFTVTEAGVQSLRIPARFGPSAKTPSETIMVKLFDVGARPGRVLDLTKQFTLSLEPADPGARAGGGLALVVAGTKELLPGAYAVAVDIAPSFDTTEPKMQTVTFSLTVPTPAVSGAPIVLHQTRFLDEPGDAPSVVLKLYEETGKAVARRLQIIPTRDTAEKNHDDLGELIVASPIPVLGPNSSASSPIAVSISASGAFGLGKTTGKLKISSVELAAPTLIPFEVHAKRHDFWIVICAVLGVLAGYFVRVLLGGRQALIKARIDSAGLLVDIDRQLEASDDADINTDLKALRERLVEADDGGDATALAALVVDLGPQVALAQSTLTAALKELRPRVDAVHILVDRHASAIPGAQVSLDELRSEVAKLDRLFERRNASAVRVLLDGDIQDKLATYVSARRDHMSDVTEYFQAMAKRPPPLPSQTADVLTSLAADLAAAHPVAQGGSKAITPTEADTELTKLWTELSRCQKVAQGIASRAVAFVGLAKHKLHVRPEDPKQVFAAVYEATDKIAGAEVLSKNIADPKVATAGYPTAHLVLADRWRETLVGLVDANKRAAVEVDIKPKIEQGKWEEAIDAAEKEVSVTGGGLGGLQDMVNAVMPDENSTKPVALPATGGAASRYDLAAVLGGTLARRKLLGAQAEKAAFLQSVLMAIVLILGVHVLYEEAWVGSLKEMLTLFLIAFSSDLSYAGVSGDLKKGRPTVS